MSGSSKSERESPRIIRVADLKPSAGFEFLLTPDAPARQALAETLGIDGIRKLRFEGRLEAAGKSDWQLTGKLGATVVQPCVVTLEPVVTRIDEDVARLYLAKMPEPEPGEVEMPEDDTLEELTGEVDLGGVMAEALSLALPAFPRAVGAELGDMTVTEPGVAPLTDADLKPFAGLAGLKDKLGGDAGED